MKGEGVVKGVGGRRGVVGWKGYWWVDRDVGVGEGWEEGGGKVEMMGAWVWGGKGVSGGGWGGVENRGGRVVMDGRNVGSGGNEGVGVVVLGEVEWW